MRELKKSFRVETAHYRWHVTSQGEGHDLVMLHSYWGSSLLFDRLAKSLATGYRVVCIDLPGHGESDEPSGPYTFEELAQDLHALLVQLGIDRFVAVGHSMGAYLWMAFTMQFPESVVAFVSFHAPLQKADRQSAEARAREQKLLEMGKRELFLKHTLPGNFAPGNAERFSDDFHILSSSAGKVGLPSAIAAIYAINNRNDAFKFFSDSTIPLLVVVGLHDQVYAPDLMMEEARQLPWARVLVLENSGHLGFIEEFEKSRDAIFHFLKAIF